MSTYALSNAHFVLPGRVMDDGYLTIVDGHFGSWQAQEPACEIVDCGGRWVAPGFVDTHIHGFYNHATTDCDAEGINISSAELVRRGTTSWIPTTFTEAPESIRAACAAIAEADEVRGAEFMGARIQGIYLEGPFFTQKHVGAQNPAFLIDPAYDLYADWQQAAGGRIVKSALAPEHDGSIEYISALAAEGIVGCAMVTPETYAEVIADGHHVMPAAVEALVRAKGWDHVVLITDCLGCGGMPAGEYMSGGLPVVMRDGACYLRDGSSLAGSVAVMCDVVKNVYDWNIVSAEQAIRMGTEVAARSAHIDDRCGSIVPGRHADFVILNNDLTLAETYLGGVRVPLSE